MPKYWYDRAACRIEDDDDPDTIADKQLNLRILADKKPYFMCYVYPEQMREYRNYRNNVHKKTIRELEQEVEDIFAKPPSELSEYESTLIQYYFFKNPVGLNLCTMNRICWTIENEIDGHLKKMRAESIFDYEALKSGTEYKNSTYYGVRTVFEDYLKQSSQKVRKKSIEKIDEYDYAQKCEIYFDGLERSLLEKCSSDDMLYDIIIDLCKSKKVSYSIVWTLFSDKIVKNLMKKHENVVHVIVADENGEIEFGGEKFHDVAVEVCNDDKYSSE